MFKVLLEVLMLDLSTHLIHWVTRKLEKAPKALKYLHMLYWVYFYLWCFAF